MIKLNIGCGRDIREGYINIDKVKLKGVNKVMNIDTYPYPFKNNSIDEVVMFHIIEHAKNYERCFNEIKRILKPNGVLHIKVPHFTAAGSNSEFHNTRFWIHSFTSQRLRKKSRTSGETLIYNNFTTISKRINFIKKPFIWNYLVEALVNINNYTRVLYEHTFLCYLFPATEMEVKLKKLK